MPTGFRLVPTLTEEGYLERTVDGMVRPSTGVLVLGFAAMQGLDLVQMSEPVQRDLAAETGETVNLGVLYGDQVLFVARIPRRDTLVAVEPPRRLDGPCGLQLYRQDDSRLPQRG